MKFYIFFSVAKCGLRVLIIKSNLSTDFRLGQSNNVHNLKYSTNKIMSIEKLLDYVLTTLNNLLMGDNEESAVLRNGIKTAFRTKR